MIIIEILDLHKTMFVFFQISYIWVFFILFNGGDLLYGFNLFW